MGSLVPVGVRTGKAKQWPKRGATRGGLPGDPAADVDSTQLDLWTAPVLNGVSFWVRFGDCLMSNGPKFGP